MSYCRDGDVYLIESFYGGYACCACRLRPRPVGEQFHFSAHMRTPGEALAHLGAHVAAGHAVPLRTFARLAEEIAERGAEYAPRWDGTV